MDETQHSELLSAINRSATRSIAIFMLGWIVWFLIGAGVSLVGILLLSLGGIEAMGGAMFILFGGLLVILIGAIRAIASALRELSNSSNSNVNGRQFLSRVRMRRFNSFLLAGVLALSGCTLGTFESSTTETESTNESQVEITDTDSQEFYAVESCSALDDLTSFLVGASGYGEDSTLVAWIVGLRNRFEEDPESEFTPDFETFRLSVSELFEEIRNYHSGLDDQWKPITMGALKSDIESHLGELSLELDYLLTKCSLPTLEARSGKAVIELGDFWATGYWVDLTEENSLGDTTFMFSQAHFDESKKLAMTTSLFCIPWVREKSLPFMMLAAANDSYDLQIEEVYEGAIRARIDDQASVSWAGDFEYPYFYKLWDDQMNPLADADRVAFQMIVDGSAFDFSLNVNGTSEVFDKFRLGGCEF